MQECVTGTVHSCAGVRWGGRIVALALARYVRTWPPDAGNAAFAETVSVPPGLGDRVDALLGAVGWEGIFELELLKTADGRFVAIDLNPRPYGSLALAIRAGADLPAVWASCLRGAPPPPVTAAAGVRYRWEDAELRGLARELRHGRLRTAAAITRPRRGTVHPYLSWGVLARRGPRRVRARRAARAARRTASATRPSRRSDQSMSDGWGAADGGHVSAGVCMPSCGGGALRAAGRGPRVPGT